MIKIALLGSFVLAGATTAAMMRPHQVVTAPAVKSVPLVYYQPAAQTFDDRFAVVVPLAPMPSNRGAKIIVADADDVPLPRPKPHVAAAVDPVCGARGRRYFRIGRRHQSWRCRR